MVNIINSTIINNSAGDKGGALYTSGYNTNHFINSIDFYNDATEGNQIYLEDFAFGGTTDAIFENCDVEGGYQDFAYPASYVFNPVTNYLNNIELAPLFSVIEGSEYTLSLQSPCINIGSPDTTGMNIPQTDIYNFPRIMGGRIDIGACEHLHAPEVSILVLANYIMLDWEAALLFPKSIVYNVYSSSDPNSLFPDEWVKIAHSISETAWIGNIENNRTFYRVTCGVKKE